MTKGSLNPHTVAIVATTASTVPIATTALQQRRLLILFVVQVTLLYHHYVAPAISTPTKAATSSIASLICEQLQLLLLRTYWSMDSSGPRCMSHL